jgi:hypothetical protein
MQKPGWMLTGPCGPTIGFFSVSARLYWVIALPYLSSVSAGTSQFRKTGCLILISANRRKYNFRRLVRKRPLSAWHRRSSCWGLFAALGLPLCAKSRMHQRYNSPAFAVSAVTSNLISQVGDARGPFKEFGLPISFQSQWSHPLVTMLAQLPADHQQGRGKR